MMRIKAAAIGALMAAALAGTAGANTPQQCIALWSGLSKANQTQGLDHQQFMASCLSHPTTGATSAPGAPDAPAGATGRCRDGAYTTAAVPLAGCDRHGGLAALVRP